LAETDNIPVRRVREFRKANYDGSVDVACSLCAKVIASKQNYRGFSTAICAECARSDDALPVIPDGEQPFSVDDMFGPNNFKATGFKRITEKVVQMIRNKVSKKKRKITN
jgi:hypothetical protein